MMQDTPIYEIARHTYAQRVQRAKAYDEATTTKCLVVLSLALLLMATVAPAAFLLTLVLALAVAYPAMPPTRKDEVFDFPAGERVPSFDMHIQDVAHRLAYRRF